MLKKIETACAWIAAAILLQTLFFKFTGAEESRWIFQQLQLEPLGRIGSGVIELVLAIALFIPKLRRLAALGVCGVMLGAIGAHVVVLGIVVQDDGGLLFALALVTLTLSLVVALEPSQRQRTPRLGSLALLLAILSPVAHAGTSAVNTFGEGGGFFSDPPRTEVAIRGYDPVAYFTEKKPVKGRPEFATKWNGATWNFASAENLKKFQAEPTRWAPQYGGYCAYGVANGALVKIEPEEFTIVEGKLYLNYDADISKKWQKKSRAFISDADAKFGQLLKD